MMNDTSRQILSIKTLFKQKQGIKYTLFKFPKSLNNGLNRSFLYEFSLLSRTFPDSPKIFSIKIPGFPEISRKFATAVRTQLRILHQRNQRFHLLWSKPFEFFHDVCIIIQLQEPRVELHLLGKRKSINVAVSDIAVYRVAHTLDKTANTFLDVLVFHSDALPPVNRSLSITIYAREHQRAFNWRCCNLIKDSL